MKKNILPHLKLHLLWMLLFIALPLASCSKDDSVAAGAEDFQVNIECPSLIEVSRDGVYAFQVDGGEALLPTDAFIFESGAGVSYVAAIVSETDTQVSVRIPGECSSGEYRLYLKRGERRRLLGKTYLSITDGLDFTPEAGTTVYGTVSTADGPLAGVVVSDGTEVTTTDERGIYQLASDKHLGYVFVSVPAGYEAPSEGVLPQFSRLLKGDASTAERADFTLTKVDGQQDRYKVLFLGDMHLANRNGDLAQFIDFTNDLNDYRARHAGERIYAITLGDMTWDLYWYSNNYSLYEYLSTINSLVKDLQIFHTMGNHDNDYKATSDLAAESLYARSIAPTYYSFNIGQVHYVVLDDIDCDNYDGTTSRRYVKRVTTEQLNWLARDLEHVGKDTPLVVVTHAQIFYPSETEGFRLDHDAANTEQLFDILDGRSVHFVTGHTHLNFNVTPDDEVTGGRTLYEHNTGAICGSWWWSGKLTPGVHLSPDGTPGGYAVWDVDGTRLQWLYKATGADESYQFRTYDLNRVSFSRADVPQMPAALEKDFRKYMDAYPAQADNRVLINIWNWNPSWTLTVTDEQGHHLEAEPVWAYDPLHIAALTVKRFNSPGLTSAPNFTTERFPHFFVLTAPDADTDLTISVRDEFGHEWTERMERPKAFSTDAYRF